METCKNLRKMKMLKGKVTVVCFDIIADALGN